MFCKNCGVELLNEEAEFCAQCGIKTGDSINCKRPSVGKRKGLIVAAIVVLFLIVLFCVKINDIHSSPEKVAVATLTSEYEVDIKTMMKCFPDFTIKEIAAEEGLPLTASRNDVAKVVKEDYRYVTPQKVKIIDTELVGEYDISEYTIFRELYDYMTDGDYEQITKVARVYVHFVIDGEEDSVKLTCIKMKNKWYYLRTL